MTTHYKIPFFSITTFPKLPFFASPSASSVMVIINTGWGDTADVRR